MLPCPRIVVYLLALLGPGEQDRRSVSVGERLTVEIMCLFTHDPELALALYATIPGTVSDDTPISVEEEKELAVSGADTFRSLERPMTDAVTVS